MSCKKYKIQNNKIIFDECEIVLDYPIRESIQINEMLIVYLDLYDRIIPLEENVFGVSLSESKIKWQIEKRNYPKGGYDKMRCPFIGISFHNNKLRLYNWCSRILIVNPATGKVLSEEESR